MMTRLFAIAAFFATILFLSLKADAADYLPPALVKVQPVFFVPKGEKPPTEEQSANFLRHLKWTQTRYKELLQDRDTFTLAEGEPQVYLAEKDLAFYRQAPFDGAPEFIRSDPWIVALPGLAILIAVVAINLTGDGLRDALDPRMRRS